MVEFPVPQRRTLQTNPPAIADEFTTFCTIQVVFLSQRSPRGTANPASGGVDATPITRSNRACWRSRADALRTPKIGAGTDLPAGHRDRASSAPVVEVPGAVAHLFLCDQQCLVPALYLFYRGRFLELPGVAVRADVSLA